MAEYDHLEFLAGQMRRLFSEMHVLYGAVDIVRRDVAGMIHDIRIIKDELKGLRADQLNTRREIDALRRSAEAAQPRNQKS